MVEIFVALYLGNGQIIIIGYDRSIASWAFYPNGHVEVVDDQRSDEELGVACQRALDIAGSIEGVLPGEEMLASERNLLKLARTTSRTKFAATYAHVALQTVDGVLCAVPSLVDKPSRGFEYSDELEEVVIDDPTPASIGAAVRLAASCCRREPADAPRKR